MPIGVSKEAELRECITRRIASGQPLTYKAILAEVGGSPATIKKLLGELVVPGKAVLVGHAARNDGERIRMLQQALDESLAREAYFETQLAATQDVLNAFEQKLSFAFSQSDMTYRTMMEEVDGIRQAVNEVKKLPGGGLPQQQTAAPTPDPLLEARYQRTIAENLRLGQKNRDLEQAVEELRDELRGRASKATTQTG